MIQFTLYTANCVGNLSNCLYPNKTLITDKETLIEAVKFDHVTTEYKNNYRNNTNFIKADNVPLDCDNDHSDNPKDWVTPEDVATVFENVSFAVVYSRNHIKPKVKNSSSKISCVFYNSNNNRSNTIRTSQTKYCIYIPFL